MSELPESWATTTVGKLADSIQYGHTAKSSKTDVGPRFLRITDIQDNNVNWKTVPFCKIPEEQIAKYRLEKGDLLFARTGATVGKSFLIHSEVPESVFASYLIRVRVTDAVEPRYIYYFFQSSDYWRQISESASGIGQPNVNGKKLAALTLPVAPLPEQRRIVARIEELFSRLDAGVAALRHAKAQLQRYRQSVLAAAVTGQLTQAWREQHPDTEPAEVLLERILEQRREKWSGKRKYKEPKEPAINSLPEIPSSWTWISPDQLSAPEDYSLAIGPFGSNLKVSDYADEGVPLVFVRHIRANDYSLSPKFVSEQKASELVAHSVDPGDLLVTKMGEPPGDADLYPLNQPHAIITADCIKLRPTPLIESRSFFVNAINSKLLAKQIAPRTRGVAQKKISLDRFRDVAFPLPPLAEQHQIVAEVESRTTAIDHLEAELDKQITRSTRLRQSTLSKAFNGGL
jgi:type I restriction enzyme S subunit